MSDIPLIPRDGFSLEHFPSFRTVLIPYQVNAQIRPDPMSSIQEDGSLTIEMGNIGIVFPNREEWRKFAWMIEALWNSHYAQPLQDQEMIDDNVPVDLER